MDLNEDVSRKEELSSNYSTPLLDCCNWKIVPEALSLDVVGGSLLFSRVGRRCCPIPRVRQSLTSRLDSGLCHYTGSDDLASGPRYQFIGLLVFFAQFYSLSQPPVPPITLIN